MTPYRYKKHSRIQDLVLVINLRGASKWEVIHGKTGLKGRWDRTKPWAALRFVPPVIEEE